MNDEDQFVRGLENLVTELENKLCFKEDALSAYASFYDKAAKIAGVEFKLPSSTTDNMIINNLSKLLSRIAELESQLKRYDWISVGDELPVDESDVETITSFGDLIDDFYDENQEFAAGFEITHWRYCTPRPGES